MRKISRALISVSDKTGVVDFAAGLADLGVEIVSTGGTAKLLRESGLTVRDVSEVTGFPEMLDGRVKTLHPKVHGGILAIRSNPHHQKQVAEHHIEFIDLVAVNLYPFEKTAAKPGVTLEELIENIDIGGPSMIRSAAKNYRDVTVVVDAQDFSPVLTELRANQGSISRETRARLARKAFATTAAYDGAISTTLQRWANGGSLPERLHQSRLIYHRAACHVVQNAVGAERLQHFGVDHIPRRRAAGNGDHENIDGARHLDETRIIAVRNLRPRLARMIDHWDAKRFEPPRDRGADATHADQADSAVAQRRPAQRIVALKPFAGTQMALGLRQLAHRAQQ